MDLGLENVMFGSKSPSKVTHQPGTITVELLGQSSSLERNLLATPKSWEGMGTAHSRGQVFGKIIGPPLLGGNLRGLVVSGLTTLIADVW